MKYLPPDLLPTLADRLRYAMEQLGMSQPAVAKAAGCSQTTIFKILEGQTRESRKTGAIARGMGISVAWLENGEMPASVTVLHRPISSPANSTTVALEPISPWDSNTPLDDDEVEVPLYKQMEIAAGHGRTAVQAEPGRVLRFSYATLRACGVSPSNAMCATVTGKSQEPLILHGTTIGIDRGMTRILAGHLYAVEQDGELRVKFLERLGDGGIRLISYNDEEYPSEDYTFDQYLERQMRVLGRVFWWSTVRPLNAPPIPRCSNTIATP
ncbi:MULTISPECIES: XRE family transcriptional regulator [Pseudomonas]|uniref:XRE family transcriptional regulator n=1 Tax=Pseudomonas TaxID=286 RepID=UPI001CEFD55B|nr:helix-turn-helix transcriptional regulator [Pseudomonas sp. HS-18]UCL88724.1 helix-turn-helix transcriptional regulator [Pseudomonas sp. HS-18]